MAIIFAPGLFCLDLILRITWDCYSSFHDIFDFGCIQARVGYWFKHEILSTHKGCRWQKSRICTWEMVMGSWFIQLIVPIVLALKVLASLNF